MIGKNLHHFVTTSTTSRTAADLRRSIAAWPVVVWAYRDEKVHYATNAGTGGSFGPRELRSSLGGAEGCGLINAALDAHPDAELIDGVAIEVLGWPGRDRLARYAEKGQMPPAEIHVPRLRVVQKLDDDGNPEKLYLKGQRREPLYAVYLVDYVGEWPDKAEAKEREWRDWNIRLQAFLGALPALLLKKWRVVDERD